MRILRSVTGFLALAAGVVLIYAGLAPALAGHLYEPPTAASPSLPTAPTPAVPISGVPLTGAPGEPPPPLSSVSSEAEAVTAAVDADVFDVEMALEVLFSPDTGGQLRNALRWESDQVTFSISPSVDQAYAVVVRDAFSWVGSVTGLIIVEVGPNSDISADISVASKPRGNGGQVVVAFSGSEIVSAKVTVGCCLARTAFEEVAQAFGPLGDNADARSIFSGDRSATGPSDFDAWVLAALYNAPATDRASMEATLRASAPR